MISLISGVSNETSLEQSSKKVSQFLFSLKNFWGAYSCCHVCPSGWVHVSLCKLFLTKVTQVHWLIFLFCTIKSNEYRNWWILWICLSLLLYWFNIIFIFTSEMCRLMSLISMVSLDWCRPRRKDTQSRSCYWHVYMELSYL